MLGKNHHFLKKFSISDAAIAYKKPRSTILKYIKSGDFELDYNKLIEYSQLVRKFGELTYPIQDEREQQIKKLILVVAVVRLVAVPQAALLILLPEIAKFYSQVK